MSSTVHEAFRTKLERILHSDSGTGGLLNSSSVAYVRGIYYAAPASSEAGPHIIYNFTVRDQTAASNAGAVVAGAEIELVVSIRARKSLTTVDPGAYSSGAVHDWGFGKNNQDGRIAAVLSRLRSVIEDQANWGSETGAAQNWWFAGATLQSIGPGAEKDADFVQLELRYTLAAVQSTTGSSLPTGLGFGFSVDLYRPDNSSFSSIMTQYSVFGYSIDVGVETQSVTRKLDLERRLTTGLKTVTVALRWYPNAADAAPAFDTVPSYSPLKIIRTPGQTFRLRLTVASRTFNFYGIPIRMGTEIDRQSGRVVGRLLFQSSAPTSAGNILGTAFGPLIEVQ